MKKQNTLIILLLTIATSFVACKKDTTSLKSQLVGRWTVTKIEGADAAKQTSNDSFTFTSNNDDQVERTLGGDTKVGSYIVVANAFNMTFSEANYYCTNVILDGSKLQFDSKNDRDNKVSTYYLTR